MRLLKQLGYGIFFLLVAAAIGAIGYFFVRPSATCFDAVKNQRETDIDCGGGCVSCALKQAKPIVIRSVQVFENNNSTVTIYGELHNPNINVGARHVQYAVTLLDYASKPLQTITRETFLYPGKNRTIIEPAIVVDPHAVREATITIVEYEWALVEEFKSVPEAQLAIVDTGFRKRGSNLVITGTLNNQNPFPIEHVALKAIVFAMPDVALNASATILEDVVAYGKKDFTITIPITAADGPRLDLKLTKLIFEIPR